MAEQRDYYEVLEVSRDATPEEIKRAYRRLARKHHPDVNSGDEKAEARFKEINEANEVLSDPQKRANYDRFGHAAVNGNGAPGGYGDFGFKVDFGGFGDIFDMFFGGAGPTTRPQQVDTRGSDLRYDVQLTLEEVATGVDKTIRLTRLEACEVCKGSGAAEGSTTETCTVCQGSGQVRQRQQTFLGTQIVVGTCPRCEGRGTVITDPCKSCNGQGRTRRTSERTIHIPAGVDDGTRIRIPEEGEAGIRGGAPGDLFVVTYIKPHKAFERRGSDLWREISVSFTQAALGATIKVKTLTGEETLYVDKGTQTGDHYRLLEKGLPDPRGRRAGDLNVVVKVETPTKLSDKEKELLKQFAELRGEDVEIREEKGFFERVRDAFGGK